MDSRGEIEGGEGHSCAQEVIRSRQESELRVSTCPHLGPRGILYPAVFKAEALSRAMNPTDLPEKSINEEVTVHNTHSPRDAAGYLSASSVGERISGASMTRDL